MKPNIQKERAAFTLTECLVTIGILAVLIALSAGPVFRGVRSSVNSVKCTSNLRQLGTAFSLYTTENNGSLPRVTGDSTAPTQDEQNGKGKQWDAQITPYIPMKSINGKTAQKGTVFFCPSSEPDLSYANKAVVPLSYTYNGDLGRSAAVKLAACPNPSTLVVLADLQLSHSTPEHSYVPQTGQGRNNMIVFSGFHTLSYRHSGKVNILFLDGSVAPRRRVVDDLKTSPPENVRWTPDGELTPSR